MYENNDHLNDSMSYLYLPLYQEFTRILIWPTQAEDEESTYQVWSPFTEIPPDIKRSEIMKIGLPFFQNHHYIAVPSDQSSPSPKWYYYHSQPDCSMFQSAVKLYSFKTRELVVPQLSFGTVDEILLPTSRILFTEHPFHLNLLGSPPASSVVSEEEKRKEMANMTKEGLGSPPATSVISEEERRKEMANMTKEGRDLIRNEIWREKMADVARRARVEANQLQRLRQWAAGIRYQRRPTAATVAWRLKVEERELMGLRDWAAGTVEEVEADTMKEDTNSMKKVRMSTPTPSRLYPSLKELQLQEPQKVLTFKEDHNSSFNEEQKEWITVPRRAKLTKKVEPILREKISISRLGWNRDQDLSSVRKIRCRTDVNLKAAAFLSNKSNGKPLGVRTAVEAQQAAEKPTDSCDEIRVSPKLYGGGKPKPPKFAKTDDTELQKLTTLTRSLSVWKRIDHEKCDLHQTNVRNNLCSFCLTRSLMLKLNMSKGRKELKPSEVSTFLPGRFDVKMLMSDMIHEISTSCPSVSDEFTASLSCSNCSEKLFGRDGDNYFIELKDHKLNEDLSILLNQYEMDLLTAHRNCNAEILQHHERSNILFLRSTTGLKLRLNKPVKFFGKSFRCKAVVTSSTQCFPCNGLWYKVQNNAIIEAEEVEIDDVLLVTLETVPEDFASDEETLTYTGADYQKIIKLGDRHLDTSLRRQDRHHDTPLRRQDRHLDPTEDRHLDPTEDRHLDPTDRHLDTPLRRQDRHHDTPLRRQDRHHDTPLRRQDRHLDPTDRHHDTPLRRQDRHKNNDAKSLQNVKKDINEDTGMDIKCCSCLELKSRGSCVYLRTLSEELIKKYCHQQEIAMSKDGKYYVCLSCQTKIKANQEPTRGLMENYGLYEFPEGFTSQLESRIVRNPYQDQISKPHTRLNRLEHCLLKPVVPFMIIGHCVRGNYFKMKGSVVMISADVTSSLEKILPVKNTLIPVSFKRKLEYKGYYLQEYIDRAKLGLYFQFFKTNNHIYEDIQVGDLEKFEEELCSEVDDKTDDSDKNDPDLETEAIPIPMSQTSLILDKYSEPINTKTFANKVGSMIFDYEQFYNIEGEDDDDERIVDDPENNCFPEDEREEFEEENSFLEKLQEVDVKLEDKENCGIISELEEMFRSWQKKSHLQLADHFCYLVKKEAHLISQKNKLLGLKSNIEDLQQLISSALSDVQDSLEETTEKRRNTTKCHHTSDNIQDKLLDEILRANADSGSDRTRQFAQNQVKQIEKNIQDLITVAPGVGGKFHSWGSDIFLEEKLFPQLFPYGIGGYLSSNLLKGSKMGFANYCKNRILSVSSKFREDVDYLFFLTIVKEQIQMRRSERTYLRKAAKVPDLTPASISSTNQEMLKRANTLYHHVRNLRGSAPYFQDSNKKLMAFLRQKGAPTLFVTLSAAEFSWDDLALRIYETVTNKPSTLEFIRSQSQSWRNKLLHDNVVQSTIHFNKRVEKIIAYLRKNPLLEHNGVKYKVDAYFVRKEFQARGAPHAHILLQLVGENGEEPPSLFAFSEDEGPSKADICSSIASFSNGVICGSATEATCENHERFEDDCDSCISMKEDIIKYQSHRHKFSCHKKKKRILITEDQGHGRYDGKIKDVALEIKSCRFNFPKNPIDKTEFILGFPGDTDPRTLKKAKADYEKIRKYLLRLTNDSDYEDTERWKKFVSMSFYQYLYEVGMFDSDDTSDVEAQQRARDRYLTALRCEVKNSGLLLLERQTEDIFTNNFNNKLMNIHRANIDVQFITDQYAVAQYVSNYLTKLEGGSTALLKNINDEALREGEAGKVTLGKLVKALDRGREVAIQEAIFRLLGLTMTNFSEVVRFINSAHPHRRDGLLKQNLDDLPEGESVFHNSVHDYYRNRPHNSKQDNTDWDKMSLAEFVSNYNIFLKKPKSERTEIITLQNKTGYVVKRSKQCVIRYFLRYENDEEYHRALLVLFFPFRDEMAEIHSEDVTMLYEAHEEEIEFVRSQFEKHRKLTDLVADIEKNQHNELGEIEEDDEEQSLKLLETTNISDIDKYIEEAQATASRILDSTKPLQKMSDDEYHEKINSLNPEQRRIFDDLVERFMDVDNPDPFYLYIGGEAGTGKSYLLRLLMEAARRIPKMSGKELDKPHYLTMAPTGVAAYIIQGMTIESALGIMPSSNRSFKMGGQSKNSQFRFTYEDLKVIFIDEISMVDSNKLNIINLRLQEIRGNNLFMGGVSIICFGDFGQLPPVGNPEMIWGKCTTDSRSKAAPNLWDDNFKIFYLKMKMRSKDDKYSEICDQVRKGELTPEVIEYLKDRERPCPSEDNLQQYQEGKISIIVTTNADRKKINSEKLDSLIPDQPAVNVVSVDKATNVLNPPPIPLGQPLTRTGQLESEFTFKKGAPVMITANSQEPRHKMNGIVNGVRGFIDSFQYEEDGSLMVIWVRFNDDKTGQLLRIENNHLLQTHKPDDNLAVPIFRMKKTFKQNEGNTNWLRHQFPLTLCFAVTAHKSQGQTLEEVLIDFGERPFIQNGLFYTAMSRVKTGENLYIREFKEKFIKANPNVELKKAAMEISSRYQFKKVYLDEEIFETNEEIKIGYINIRGLLMGKSLEFLNNDRNLQQLSYLVVSETWLTDSITNEYLTAQLSNWNIHHRRDAADGHRHMGLLVLQAQSASGHITMRILKEHRWTKKHSVFAQILEVNFEEYLLQASFVYINQTPTNSDVTKLCGVVEHSQLIIGDLNLDGAREGDQDKLSELCGKTKSRILKEVTTDQFSQLDHILLNETIWPDSFATSFYEHTSDHKIITIRLPNLFKKNKISKEFKQRLHFDQFKETIVGQKRKADSVSQSPKRQKLTVTSRKRKSDEINDDNSPAKTSRSVPVIETLPVLSQEMLTEINDVFRLPDDNIVSDAFGLYIRKKEIVGLKGLNWLNSDIIDFMFRMIAVKSDSTHSFTLNFSELLSNTNHETVKHFTNRLNIFTKKKILIPVHTPDHWSCVGINMEQKEIIYYDSLRRQNNEFLEKVLTYLDLEHRRWGQCGLRLQDWSCTHPKDIPQQENGSDCGVFAIKFGQYFAKGRSRGDQMEFTQQDMPYYRRRMVWEIKEATLLWP